MREIKINHAITGRDTESLNIYLHEVGKIPLLTVEEEIQLTIRARNGDRLALDRLVRTNLRFVISVAKKYQHRGLSLGDLINEGNLGLIKAASRFDETKGFKFISFAVWWIRQAIMLAISQQTRIIRLPLNLINSISKINVTASCLEQKLERSPTMVEIAGELKMEPDRVTDDLDKVRKCVSLDDVVKSDSTHTLLETIPVRQPAADHVLIVDSDRIETSQLLKILSKREEKVLSLFFGLRGMQPLSLDDIALIFKLSRERIRQLKDSGIKKLRQKLRKEKTGKRTKNI
ncbi:RNA polymerase sigma factor rpoD [Pedobacter lusitanus]|uniref:RNA polymerase sigma factor rpoD n=1 Tax=Pedobacter lusitanus TaxID=1503925 RepID=A0A0D0GTP8_9SPHI|nr:RNA polymerase sigma factor RpoD/SigA [Pedobacter lusitanus]KIO77786.1 RNA polymerase sigma factor rpoD [Pedobacter lusitanus]